MVGKTNSASPELKNYLKEQHFKRNYNFIRKLGVIRESIFGVDILPIAIEFSRLRCFLTLIVDQVVEDESFNRGIQPLPNLDFKFISANTLNSLDLSKSSSNMQAGLFEDSKGIDELKKIRNEYFISSYKDRDRVKDEFVKTQKKIYNTLKSNNLIEVSDATQKLTLWDPFIKESVDWFDQDWMFGLAEGFDIVIGNPPYNQLQSQKFPDDPSSIEKLGEQYKKLNYKKYNGRGDIYCLFYEKGLEILKRKGILCFISSNKWMKTAYGKKLRELFMEYNTVFLIDFGGLQIFETPTVDTNIILIKNEKQILKLEV